MNIACFMHVWLYAFTTAGCEAFLKNCFMAAKVEQLGCRLNPNNVTSLAGDAGDWSRNAK